ncbi:Ig-like domain-containing protein, partial [Ruminococcus flavefaciens]|uniref:Ig-like domain-containing protein n=1 Tax=Ruminococcus flavefaciens TaxID=1265 RepID=UPI0026F3635B
FAYMSAAQKLAVVDVASVAITNAPTAAITVGNTGTLTATVAPDNATNKTVTWAVTEGADVLSINAATGAYTALKAGTAKVTATAGGKTAECTITVNAPQPKTLTIGDYTFNYIEGQKWNEITLPAGVYIDSTRICYDEYDPFEEENTQMYLDDVTTGNYVYPNDVIDPTHSYRWW